VPAKHYSVRRRKKGGYLVLGPGGIFGTKIATRTKRSANRIRAKLKRGLDIGPADWR
jgi:hypothetical protein